MSGKAKKVREKKETTLFLAVIPILAMIVLLGVGYAVMGLSPEVLDVYKRQPIFPVRKTSKRSTWI